MKLRKSCKEWSFPSNDELEAKFIAKSITLSDEDEINPGPFIVEGTDCLTNVNCNFLQLVRSKFFVFALGSECLHIVALCIFQNSLAVTACSSNIIFFSSMV